MRRGSALIMSVRVREMGLDNILVYYADFLQETLEIQDCLALQVYRVKMVQMEHLVHQKLKLVHKETLVHQGSMDCQGEMELME